MSKNDRNELLTRVEGDAPMGRMLRDWFWVPAIRAARVEPGAPPVRVRFFGENFVLFRAADGRVGCLDEACPHRGASLALAHPEGGAIRCVYHGWKLDVDGKVLEVPNQTVDPAAFAAKVKVRRWPTREAGGIIWIYLGAKAEPPRFSDLEFTRLRPENLVLASTIINCNWVQALDGALDSAHVAMLHQSFIGRAGGLTGRTAEGMPEYEVERTPYGLRAAAIRPLVDGNRYVRVTVFVMPWYGLTPLADPASGERTALLSVPVDDTHTQQWFIRFNSFGKPADPGFGWNITDYDIDNFTPVGAAGAYWGQDREAVKRGHFTGFTAHHLVEDSAIQVSMGPIVDRGAEQLTSTDLAVVQMRRVLLEAVDDSRSGKGPAGTDPALKLGEIQSESGVLPGDVPWSASSSGRSLD